MHPLAAASQVYGVVSAAGRARRRLGFRPRVPRTNGASVFDGQIEVVDGEQISAGQTRAGEPYFFLGK